MKKKLFYFLTLFLPLSLEASPIHKHCSSCIPAMKTAANAGRRTAVAKAKADAFAENLNAFAMTSDLESTLEGDSAQ